MPCLKAFIIPAESCIFKWNGYKSGVNATISDIALNKKVTTVKEAKYLLQFM